MVNNDPLIGTVLDDRYKVVQYIGQGGMSLVYKAEHAQMERAVAIKLLKSEYTGEATNIQRFRREAQAASVLQHPNINSVYAVGVTAAGQPYLVLEFLEGKRLAELLESEKPLSPERAAKLFMQILEGLAQAHNRGVVHRDLKPSNIMITHDADGAELVKIVDFGTAKLAPNNQSAQQQLTQAGEVLGTLLYMAPEQKRGQAADARCDIYAVGYMLHEATEKDGVTPTALNAIVQKALEEQADRRYQSAAAMREDLQKLLNPDVSTSTSMPIGRKEEAPHAVAPRKFVIVGVAALAFLLAASAVFILNSPARRDEFSYRWLSATNASPDKIIESADTWAQAILDSHENYADALAVYKNCAEPLFPKASPLVKARALYGMGRVYCAMNDIDAARKCDLQLMSIAVAFAGQNKLVERNTVFLYRSKLETIANSTGPASNTKLTNLLDTAARLEKHDMFDEAETVYKIALDVAANSASFQDRQCEILSNYIALAERLGQKEKAVTLNEKLHSLIEKQGGYTADNVAALIRHGEYLVQIGNTRGADMALHQALEVVDSNHPLAPRLWTDLGTLCKQRARMGVALEYLLKAARAHDKTPLAKADFARCFTDIGLCYRRSGEEREAAPYFERVYRELGDDALIMPESDGLAHGLMLVYYNTGRANEANKIGQRAIELAQERDLLHQQQYFHVANDLAEHYLQKRETLETSLKYGLIAAEIAEGNNDKAVANNVIARAYDALDRPVDAEKYNREAVRLSANSALPLDVRMSFEVELALNLVKLHQTEEAKKLANDIKSKAGGSLYSDVPLMDCVRSKVEEVLSN